MTTGSAEEDFWAPYRASDPALDETILKGIDQIEWPQLKQAYGAATDIPANSAADQWFRNYYEQQGIDYDALVARAAEYARLAHQAVYSGLGVYLALLDDPQASARAGAVRLLCEYAEDAEQILPALFNHIANETDEETQGSTLNGFEHRTYPVVIDHLVPGELSQLQKEAVKAVQRSDKIQGIKSNLLKAFGTLNLTVD